jgi:hypothetical protein
VLRRIPADQVERIDIIVGGAPGIDMHGRAIIANVILKSSATVQRVASVADYVDPHGRNSPYGLLSSSEKHGDRVVEGSLEVSRNIGIFPQLGYGPWVRYDGTGAVEFAADSHMLVGGATAVGTGLYQFPLAGGALKVNVAGRYYHYLWGERDFLPAAPGFYGWEEKDMYDQFEVGVHYERAFGRATFETQLLERLSRNTSSENDLRPPTPSLFDTAGGLDESAVRSALRFKKDDRINIEAFAEGAFNDVDNNSAEQIAGVTQTIPAPDVTVAETRLETGATLNWKPTPAFGLDGTLKLERTDISATGDVHLDHTLAYWKPRVILTWSIDKDTQLRLRAEHEVGQINFGYFATYTEYASDQLRVGNADIRPQRDWVGEAVFERHFWNGADLTLTARELQLQDVVDLAPLNSAQGVLDGVTNIGNGHQTDFIANVTVPLKHFGLDNTMIKGTVTASRSRIADPTSGQERPLSGQSELVGELHFAQDFPQAKINWGIDAFYRGATTFYRPLGNETLAAWPHLNLFVEYHPTTHLVFRGEMQDIPGAGTRDISDVFTGLRDVSPLSYADERRLANGPVLYLRVRDNF